MKIFSKIFIALSLLAIPARAALSPVGLAILPPVQFPFEDVAITGARVSALWGHHRNVYGIDVGVVGNVTDLNFGGMAVAGIFNLNFGSSTIVGFQVAGITNINVNKAQVVGLQAAAAVNSNQAESVVVGLQIAALANLSPHTDIWGVQGGLYNTARVVYGVQLGLVNVADELHGLQIGLVNVHRKGLFAVCPVINFGF